MPADTPPVVTLARNLLGRILASDVGGERTSGVIVETEAYLGIDDPAAHAWQGKRRKGHLGVWSPPGSWYVYRSYGIHWCLDITSEPEGVGAAVLIRAIEPLEGIEVMRRRRAGVPDKRLADGPGKLCAALGVTGELDGNPVTPDGVVRLEGWIPDAKTRRTLVTPRIGISRAVDWPLRFLLLPAGQ
jgi:DNA-3-methyladenine glycosylase